MYCPQCNMPRPNGVNFCHRCGTPLATTAPKKGKLWPPIVFMVVMLVVGSIIFAVTVTPTPQPSDTPWFAIKDGTLSFDPDLYTGGPQLEIPETVNGQTVTALSDECFANCDELETVILPDTLLSIGDQAFMGCDNLHGIKLTEQITSIGSEAFYNCSSLEAIYIPESVESVGIHAFSACLRLEHIFFAGDLTAWMELYPQYISNDTQIYAVSGPDADSYTPL